MRCIVILKLSSTSFATTMIFLAIACQQHKPSPLQFEPAPRPVIAQSGLLPSHNGRVGVDWVSSPTVHLLAVVGENDGARLALFNSQNGGDSFDPPVRVSEQGKEVTSSGEDSPAFFVTQDDMFAAWNEGSELRFARSLSWGGSFEKPIKITDKIGSSFSGYPSIGVAPNRDVYVVWLDTRERQDDSDDNYAVYLARSTDHGATFGKNIRVAIKVCPCCRPTVSFGPNGEVLVIWRHVYPGPIHDMTVAISTDNGATFSPPQRIAEDNWKINGCPDSGPAVARTGRRVYVAWLTEANPQISGVRLSWSDDGGKTWAPAIMGSQSTVDANYPAFTVGDDGNAVLVFQGRDPHQRAGWSPFAIYTVRIGPAGEVGPPVMLPGLTSSAMRPAVAAGIGGRLFVTWTSEYNGKQAVFLSRGRSTPGA